MNEYKLFDEPQPKQESKLKKWLFLTSSVTVAYIVGYIIAFYICQSHILENFIK